VNGRLSDPTSHSAAIESGVTCVPQNRRNDGCVLPMSTGENLSLGRLDMFTTQTATIRSRAERADAERLVRDYNVMPPVLSRPIATLSGGNQQKVVVARAASHESTILVLDEPTQGVDALAKQEIWNIVRKLADSGVGVILASTDFDELETLSDRVVVLDRGVKVAEVEGDDISESRLAALASQADANQRDSVHTDSIQTETSEVLS
jgi:ribose transport system ATP-binding protein